MKTTSKKVKTPKKSKDIPVTQGMLYEVRNELKKDIGSVRHEVSSVRHEVSSVRHEIEAVKQSVEALREEMNSKFDKVISEVHRIGLLVEEQNARNKYVLDGYTHLSDRLDKVEGKNL